MRPRRLTAWTIVSALAVGVLAAYAAAGAALLLRPPSLVVATEAPRALVSASSRLLPSAASLR
ncbi:hypothetical protein [Phenylobacterium sp.]|uniref:hypothetical protein n=1 Tax=Phenylobacterium sp. TaxID=1871053 RepID=UPI0035AF0504